MELRTPYYLDVSTRPLLELEGPDCVDLLQRISTNDVASLKVGEHTETVLTNEKGRVVDLLVVFRTGVNSLTLVGASNDQKQLAAWIQKFIVMEDIRLTFPGENRISILLFNMKDDQIFVELTKMKVHSAQLKPENSSRVLLVAERNMRGKLFEFFRANGFAQASRDIYAAYRIENGIPEYPNELSTRFNPLEIGLQHLISFTKGCYVGQEVIARLDTYDKLRQTLQRLQLSSVPVTLPTDLEGSQNQRVGILTSYCDAADPGGQRRGLGVVQSDVSGLILQYATAGGEMEGKATLVTAEKGASS